MAEERQQSEWEKREIGAFWTKESSKDGSKFWTGDLTVDGKNVKVVMYKNDKKTEEKHPSLKVYLERPNPNEAKAKAKDNGDFPE